MPRVLITLHRRARSIQRPLYSRPDPFIFRRALRRGGRGDFMQKMGTCGTQATVLKRHKNKSAACNGQGENKLPPALPPITRRYFFRGRAEPSRAASVVRSGHAGTRSKEESSRALIGHLYTRGNFIFRGERDPFVVNTGVVITGRATLLPDGAAPPRPPPFALGPRKRIPLGGAGATATTYFTDYKPRGPPLRDRATGELF